MKFGAYIKAKRIEKGITLREFSRKIDFVDTNWAKIENGKMRPFLHLNRDELRKKLLIISEMLNIAPNSTEFKKLESWVYLDCQRIPGYVFESKHVDLFEAVLGEFQKENSKVLEKIRREYVFD